MRDPRRTSPHRECIPTDPNLWKPENFHAFLEYRRAELADTVNRFLDQLTDVDDTTAVDLAGLIESGLV